MSAATISPPEAVEKAKVAFSIRIPPDLYLRAKRAARAEDRTLAAWIVRAIRSALETQGL